MKQTLHAVTGAFGYSGKVHRQVEDQLFQRLPLVGLVDTFGE